MSTSFEGAPYSPIHRKIAYGAYTGMACDGYTLGIVGISLSYATTPLGLDGFWLGLCGTGSMVGLLLGSLVVGGLTDRIGRRTPFMWTMIAMVLLSLAQFFVTSPQQLTIIRLLLGMVIGADYTVGITLLNEWTPSKYRDNAMTQLLMYWTIGYVVAYIMGFFIESLFVARLGDETWRYIICTSAIPGVAALIIRLGSPESPMWLANKKRFEEARALVGKYIGEGFALPEEEKVASASWFRLFSKELWSRTLVGGVFFACQVLPFFGISIFVPLVLDALNIENPHASGILYNVFTMIGVLIGMWLIPRMTRRAFLLWTFYGAAAILAVMTVWQGMPGPIAMFFLIAFSTVLAISIVIEFLYPPELFPTELRASGVGISIAGSRIGAAAGVFLLPVVNEAYGVYAVLGGCVITLLIGGIVCHMYAPETSAKK